MNYLTTCLTLTALVMVLTAQVLFIFPTHQTLLPLSNTMRKTMNTFLLREWAIWLLKEGCFRLQNTKTTT